MFYPFTMKRFKVKLRESWANNSFFESFFSAFFFLFFLGDSLAAYGSSQARGQIRATAAGLCHSHSNVESKLHVQPTP